jgi:DNA-directed RNA polymerase specialized sigma24 family protein
MTKKEVYQLLEDYPNFAKRIIKLNHEIHDLMRAFNENFIRIQSSSITGLPKSNKLPDPVTESVLETEKLNTEYQNKIRQIANVIMATLDNKARIDAAMNTLDRNARDILELRYIKRLGWISIAEITCYSDRQCRNVKDKAVRQLIKAMS